MMSFLSLQLNVTTVRDNLPKGDFSIMTEMLKKFLNFMNLTVSRVCEIYREYTSFVCMFFCVLTPCYSSLQCDVGTTGQKSISRIIDYLEHC